MTRARPVIDRIACPWPIARFIDHAPEFLFAPPAEVLEIAAATGATPFHIPGGVALSHRGEGCSFDSLLEDYDLRDRLCTRWPGSCAAPRPDLTPQSAGLLAISLRLRSSLADDHQVSRHGFVLYDALYLWCRELRQQAHRWPPAMS